MSFRSLASLRVAAFLAALLVVSACDGDRPVQLSAVETIDIPAADPGPQANQNISNPTLFIPDTFPVAEGDELTLVWQEEFNGPDIDPETWFFATGDGTEKGLPGGWGNNELQYYLPDNAQIVNGVLEITARRETVGDLNYTSARINTEDRFAFKYGRIEASIKMPSGQGLWPAFWMLSQDSDYVCGVDNQGNDRPCIWAAIGEIDIVEAVNLDGTNGNEIFATIHYGGEFPANQSTSVISTPSVDVTENFNTYAIEWGADEIRWYFNGGLYAAQRSNVWFSAADNAGPSAPFDQNFHILLNLAVGGNFPGDPNGTTPFPATMEVDWVRVYRGEDPDGGVATEPNVSAPTPTEDPAGVVSLYSDAYDDIAGINYNPDWGQATVFTEAQIAGNNMLKYADLDYQGIDFAGNPQDVSDKGFLHVDVWTADSTALNVYLISPGPAETAYALPVTPNTWVTVDIPLAEFAGVDITNLIQLKFDGNGTIFLDNLYFAGDAPIIVPPVGVAPPSQDEADVISLFSGAYTNETVTWPTVWSEVGAVNDVTIDGTLVKEHLGVNFVGVEFVVDASAMTHLHVDVWTPDAGSLLLRLVDFLGDGFAGPNGDTQGEQTFDLSSSQGEWVSLDIPLADFQAAGLTSLTDLNQLVIDPTPDGTTLYTANVYFYNADGTGGADHGAGTAGVITETATESPITVLSITNSIEFFGNDTVADAASTAIPAFEGAVVLSITYNDSGSTYGGAVLNYADIDLTAYDTLNFTIDTSGITDFADLTIQMEPPGAGADGTKVLLSSYTPVATSGNWATYAIPLADFPVTNFAAVANLGFWNPVDGSGLAFGTVYVDDVYYSTEAGSGADHGAGTAGVITETATESPITVLSITNSIEFFGNDTVADAASTAIPAFEGAVVLSITYNDSGSTYGGAVLNYADIDLTAYDTLNFTIDTSGITDFADLTIQMEPPGAGADGTKVLLSSYTPVATSGNWATYAIPLADFPVTNFAAVANLGFWNPVDGSGLAFGTVYVDDVYYSTEAGSGADHGAGTAGVITETATESPITVLSITNSIEFFGNDTVADAASTAIPAFEGAVVLSITYNDSGSTYGGAVLNYADIDLTAYDTLNFTIDTSGITDFADLTIQMEPPGAGADGTKVLLSSYTPVATSGNWATYAIPLADFPVTNFAAVANLGFWNPVDGSGLAFGTVYVDDVYYSTEGGGGNGGTGAATGELVLNGDFEDGLNGWVVFDSSTSGQGGTISVGAPNSTFTTGSSSARIYSDGGGQFPLLKLERLSEGVLANSASVTVSFDWYNPVQTVDSNAGPIVGNNVVIVQLLTERTGDNGATSEDLIAPPTFLSAGPNWQQATFTTVLGADAGGGVSLFFQTNTGGNADAEMDLYIDNVSIVIN